MRVLLAGRNEDVVAPLSAWLREQIPAVVVTTAQTVEDAMSQVTDANVDCIVILQLLDALEARWRLARHAREQGAAVMFVSDEPIPEQLTLRGASVVSSRELTAEAFADFVICLVASATGIHPAAR
jgi:hypothetical protein